MPAQPVIDLFKKLLSSFVEILRRQRIHGRGNLLLTTSSS